MTARLLIVWHSRTGAAEQMAQALADGAAAALVEMAACEQVTIVRQPAAASPCRCGSSAARRPSRRCLR